MEEKVAKHISDKGLASRLYAFKKENSQHSTVKTQTIQLENAYNMKR